MINRLLQFSLHNRWLMLLMSLALMGIGYFCFTQLKIEAYPDIADTNVIIVAKYDGRASEEVEQQVTVPIERALQNTPNVLDRRSRTIFGLSVVQLTFKDGTDDYFARQQVLERLNSVNLPAGVSSTGKPAAMPPVQTTQPSQAARVGDEGQRKPITANNFSPKNPSQANIIKNEESNGKMGSKK